MADDVEDRTEQTLGELGEFRNGANFSQDDYGPGFPIVNVKQLYRGRYASMDDLNELSAEAVSKPETLFLRYGDILFARSSVKASGAGQVAMVGPCKRNAVFSGFIIRFRVNATDRVAPEYLNYLLRSPIYRELLTRIGCGTTITNLSQDTLAGLPIPLPPLAEQKAIAAVLGALDDKIELNRRMNATLEAMARALFQSWFVDFDPVRAKLDGRPPAALDPTTAALFPDSFDETELGHVPHGWEVKTLGEVIELAYGKPLKAEDRKNGPVCVYGANGPVGWHDEKLVSGPGIVVGRKGNPGVVTWAHGDFHPIDTTFYVEPIGVCRSLYFFYYALSLHNLANLSADSAVPGLNRNHAYMSKQVIPSQSVLAAFDSLIAPIFAAIHANQEQSRTLATLRDTLLPKLLSGELEVEPVNESE